MNAIAWTLLSASLIAADPSAPAMNSVRIAPNLDAKEPQLAVDSAGRAHATFGVEGAVHYAVSADGGKSFSDPLRVGSAQALALGMRRGPRIAATGDSVIIAAIGGEMGGGRDGDVLVWRSGDRGANWSGPEKANAVSGSAREGLHALAAGPDGRVACVWLDLREDGTTLYGAISKDGGATWNKDKLVYRSPDQTVCECCHPSAAYGSDGRLRLMWRNQIAGKRDLFFTESDSDGASFEPARKLGHGSWKLAACPMDGGALAVGPKGEVATVWRRANRVYAAAPGQPERELGLGLNPWAAYGPDGLYVMWLERKNGRLFASLPSSSKPVVLAEEATDPVAASGPGGAGPVIAAWQSPRKSAGSFARRLDLAP